MRTEKNTKAEKPNLYIELVAEQKQIPYEKAKKQMDKILEKYDIDYREYAERKLYKAKSYFDQRDRIRTILELHHRYIQQVCDDTGWSFQQAEAAAKEAKEKYGFSYRTFATYQFFACTEEEIEAKRELWRQNRKKYRNIVKEHTGWNLTKIKKHMTRYQVLYNIIPAYYVLYQAWDLTDEEMNSYARQELSRRLWGKYNDRDEARILGDKLAFDQLYRDYIGRKFWTNVDTSFDQFKAFTDGIDAVFCKPVSAGGGIGTSRVELDHDEEKLKALYDDFMSKDRMLVEECVSQHPEIDAFYAGSVNTIRVVILQKEDVSHIICTGIRFGHSGITDNFSKDGMVADIDPETGVIVTNAIDKAGCVYETHPVSGKAFKGFQIPMWDQVIETARKAIQVQSGVNYVGWDLAVCRDKVVIIEGNSMPDLVLVQAPYAPERQGKKYLFDPYF